MKLDDFYKFTTIGLIVLLYICVIPLLAILAPLTVIGWIAMRNGRINNHFSRNRPTRRQYRPE